MVRSKLWLKVFLYIFLTITGCSLAIALYVIPITRETTYSMEENYAVSLVDRVYNLVEAKHQEIEAYRKFALQSRKEQLRNITLIAEGYITAEYEASQAGEVTEEAAKERALNYTRRFLYGKKDYVWISDFNSVLISHPDDRLHGKDFSKVLDVHGNSIVPPMVEVARRNGEGFTSYWWNRLGKTQPVEKLTYSRLFEPWSWVLGTGLYVDDIEEEVARKKEELINELRAMMSTITIGKSGYMYIFDARNNMIIHPNKSLEGSNFSHLKNPLSGRPIAEELTQAARRKDNRLVYRWDRPDAPGEYIHDKISWVRYFPDFDWYIASSAYTDELYETSRSLTKRIAFISAAIFLISLGVGYFFLKRLLKPIERLSKTALEVKNGNLQVRSGIRSRDEIGILAREFDGMVDKLRDHVMILDAKVREKTRELSDHYQKLEHANSQILDSIEYARTIQYAILPSEDLIARHVNGHFVLWNPKDLIGGDIFAFEVCEDGFLTAVIDCTGHGVPGAVMTMIAATSLSRVIHDKGHTDPATILRELNLLVRGSLNQDEAESKSDDGFDIGVCLVNKKEQVLTFAGAKINLYYTNNGDVLEVKGDRQSIGYRSSDPRHSYTNHRLRFDASTVFYLATDGITDQSGGENGFPFGKRRFKEFLLDIHMEPMEKQKENLLKVFHEYRGQEAQRDDITVLGFTPGEGEIDSHVSESV